MRRCEFIKLSAFSAAAISFPFIQACTGNSVNKVIATPAFLTHIFDTKTIRETGLAYLMQVPDENDISKLESMLSENSSIAHSTDTDQINSFFAKKISNDFRDGNISFINGWILSTTEARQCALYTLIKN